MPSVYLLALILFAVVALALAAVASLALYEGWQLNRMLPPGTWYVHHKQDGTCRVAHTSGLGMDAVETVESAAFVAGLLNRTRPRRKRKGTLPL